MRDGALNAGNGEEVALGFFDTLGNRGRDFLGLAITHTNLTIAVADNNQSGEAKATSTLNHLGHAVDRYHALEVSTLFRGWSTAITTVAAFVAACSACHQLTLVSVVAEVIVIRSRDLLRGRHQPKLQRVRRNGFHHGQTRPC